MTKADGKDPYKEDIVDVSDVSDIKKLDHIWMFTVPQMTVRRKIHNGKEIEFRFSFSFQTLTHSVKIKKCGVGLINNEEESEVVRS